MVPGFTPATGPIVMRSAAVSDDMHVWRAVYWQPLRKRSRGSADRQNRLPTEYGSAIPIPFRCGSAITRFIPDWRPITAREDPGRGISTTIIGVGNVMAMDRVPHISWEEGLLQIGGPSLTGEGALEI